MTDRWTRAFLPPAAAAGAAASLACAAPALAEPHVPDSDDVVLERLPAALVGGREELAAIRARLAAAPGDAAAAAAAARRLIDLGSAGGGPRMYGYAEAALAPWWTDADAPADVLRLRAKLKEIDHRYDDAAADLLALLERSPGDRQAWIELSNIRRVQGRYVEARAASDALAGFADGIAALYTRTPLQAVTGELAAAAGVLERALPQVRAKLPETLPWVHIMRAQVATQQGRADEARAIYDEALEASPGDGHLLRGYGDLLLDLGEAGAAYDLLKDGTADNGVMLRAAIAARETGRSHEAERWTRQLGERFREIRLRGGEPHGRFESRHLLHLKDDPRAALEVGLANWANQKELRDSRNVLEAAAAAGDAAAAAPVIEFLRRHGTQDAALERLIAQLEAL